MKALFLFLLLVLMVAVSKYFARRFKTVDLLLTDEQRHGGSVISRGAALVFLGTSFAAYALAGWLANDWTFRLGFQVLAMVCGLAGIAHNGLSTIRRRKFPAEFIRVCEQLAFATIVGFPLFFALLEITKRAG